MSTNYSSIAAIWCNRGMVEHHVFFIKKYLTVYKQQKKKQQTIIKKNILNERE